jgi:UDP-glucose 4-epimerase
MSRALNSLTNEVVVVTGGAGFIGSHLCDSIAAANPRMLIIIDDFSLGNRSNIKDIRRKRNVKVYRQDATNYNALKKIFSTKHPDVVFNLAVLPLPKSLKLPMETIEANVIMTTSLCELLRKEMFKTLIHCSSSEAYGSALYVPMDENHPEKPLTPYAASKIACDNIAISYHKTFALDIAIARPFNSYGPRQNDRSYAGVIPLTINRILRGHAPVIFGDGNQTRDYTFVEDTVRGILGVYNCTESRGNVVNIASGKEVSIKHIMDLIVKMTGYKGRIIHKPSRPGDVRRHRGDISLAKRLFDYAPKVDLNEGLRRTIDWYSGGPRLNKN